MLPISEILEKIKPREKSSLPLDEYFLGLVINSRQVQAALWNFSADGGQAKAFGSWESWGGENAEELIVAADASIASAVTNLLDVSDKQPTRVILGLPDFWVDGQAIKKEKLEILENVCKKLLLKPLGFVVTPEAVANFVKKEEGGSVSLILVNIDESEIIVSLIVGGKFLGSKVVGRSNSLALDLDEGLMRFDLEGALPTRILLLGSKTLEEERQALLSYPWVSPENEKRLKFLQFPKIEIARENFEMLSVISAGSRELLGLGFVTEGVEEKEKSALPEAQLAKEGENSNFLSFTTKEEFGFVENQDILLTSPSLASRLPESTEPALDDTSLPQDDRKNLSVPRRYVFPISFRKIKHLLNPNKLFNVLGGFFKFFLQKNFLIGGLSLVGLLGLAFVLFTRVARSEIKLLVQAQKFEKEFEFTASPKTDSVNIDQMVLPAHEVTIEVSGKKSTPVKGRKTVGDKATGEVIFYNGTDRPKTLPSGSILRGPGGLRFLLKEETVVPARTTDLNTRPLVDKWGEKKAPVQAEQIGTQYNLPANSSFTLESLPSSSSSFLVENPAPFSGGTSREIQAVSKEDRESLQKELSSELQSQAKQDMKKKISASDYLLEDSLKLTDKIDHFDGEIGDEASTLSLEGKYAFSALYLKKEDLKMLVDKVLSSLVPEGYRPEPVNKELTFEVKDKTERVFLVKMKGDFLPAIDSDEIALRLKGRKFSVGEAYLKTLPKVAGVEISFRPKFFSLLKLFPFQKKNINLEIQGI